EDRLELMELTVFLLPSDEKVRIEVSAIDLQVSAVRVILLLLVQKFLLFGLTNLCCSLNAVRSSIAVKKVNDVTRLQTLVDKKRVIITEATIRDALRLNDAEGVECLPNEEIFAELARMGYEKPSTKLTFYKAFFSSQKQVGDLSTHTTKYYSPALTQKEFANMRKDKIAQALEITKLKQRVKKLEKKNKASKLKRLRRVGTSQRIETSNDTVMDDIDLEHADKVLSMQDVDIEPAELKEVVEVVTTTKLITKVVAAASVTITAAAPQLTIAAAPTLTTAPSVARRRKAVGMTYDDIRPIFEKKFNSNVAFLPKTKEQMDEEDSRAFKRLNYHIYYNTVDFTGREEISTYKVHSESTD
nr:hypothetical protein [Tanacetum cinerariifolium]